MDILCTRPNCPRPQNFFADIDNPSTLKTVQQKYCTACGMPLILAGRYLPSRLLGEGGFGRAFLASDRYTPTMRKCVVKQFQPSGNLSPQELATAETLFEREAEVLEQLGNKNEQIPDLYAFFPLIIPNQRGNKEEQFFYLVQEFIEGQTLEEELLAKGKFSEVEVQFVLEEMLRVLQFVHENHSIHRDIKPSNIMRDRSGRLYLLDFGAVKQVTAGAGSGRSTGIYSMGFAPPEQMSGSQVYPSTDLYALASTCLNLLTGKKPEDLFDAYRNCWNWQPSAPQVSPRLAAILDRMLLPTPKDRFQSAQEVLYALHSAPNPPPSQTTIQRSPSPSPAPQRPSPPPTPASQVPASPLRQRSLLEILGGAAFTGFEGALLWIALNSLLPAPGLKMGLWGMVLGGLIFAQYRRLIEKIDLVIIGGISLALLVFIPVLRGTVSIQWVLIISILVAAAAIAVMAFFQLIYRLLSRLL